MEALAETGLRAPRLAARWLGRVSYDRGLALQQAAATRAGAGGEETLLLLEHEPVFTLGRNAAPRRRPLGTGAAGRRASKSSSPDRGGKVTYHGPGQLVGYPILNLDPDRRDVKRVRARTSRRSSSARSPTSASRARVRRARIASPPSGSATTRSRRSAIHVARWVTTHGFALNVTDEPLARFAGIVPCGITDGGVTSVERELGRAPAADATSPPRSSRSSRPSSAAR